MHNLDKIVETYLKNYVLDFTKLTNNEKELILNCINSGSIEILVSEESYILNFKNLYKYKNLIIVKDSQKYYIESNVLLKEYNIFKVKINCIKVTSIIDRILEFSKR